MLFSWWLVHTSVFWCLSSIASVTGTILSITIPALYSRYQDHIDRFAGLIHQQMSHHYKIVDENVISRIPRSLSKDKDSWTECRWITERVPFLQWILSFLTCSFHSESEKPSFFCPHLSQICDIRFWCVEVQSRCLTFMIFFGVNNCVKFVSEATLNSGKSSLSFCFTCPLALAEFNLPRETLFFKPMIVYSANRENSNWWFYGNVLLKTFLFVLGCHREDQHLPPALQLFSAVFPVCSFYIIDITN